MATTIRLSNERCLFCPTTEDTVELKSNRPRFLVIVCPKHQIQILRQWKKEETHAPAQAGS